MSEKPATYQVEGAPAPHTLDAFNNRACLKPFCSGDYIPPTVDEVRALKTLLQLSGKQMALITGVNWNDKGSSTVTKWISGKEKDYRQIPYAAWRQLLEFAGLATIGDVHMIFARHK